MTVGISSALRNSRLQLIADAIDNGGDEYEAGHLLIYSGDRPATGGELDEYDNILLLDFLLPYPCGSVADGVLTFDVIASVVGLTSGLASFARITDADDNFVADLSVSEEGDGGEVILDYTAVLEGVTVTCTGATLTEGNA